MSVVREDAGGPPAAPRIWPAPDGVHIDVRGLAPPRPLVAILRLVEAGPHEGVLVVHLHRDPVHLYGELAARGWTAETIPGEPGEVRLRLVRDR